MTGETEIWYKDNNYKIIIKSFYEDGNKSEVTKWINCDNNKMSEFDSSNNIKIERDTWIDKDIYFYGNFIKTYMYWINIIDKQKLAQYALRPNWIYLEQKNNESIIYFNKIKIRFNKNSMMPISYTDNTNESIIIAHYNIIKNCVSDEDLKIKEDL